MQWEENQQKADAFGLVARELGELIAVTGAAENCSLAQNIYQRGQQVSTSDEKLKAFSGVVRSCPSHAAAHSGLREIYMHKGRVDDAAFRWKGNRIQSRIFDPQALSTASNSQSSFNLSLPVS